MACDSEVNATLTKGAGWPWPGTRRLPTEKRVDRSDQQAVAVDRFGHVGTFDAYVSVRTTSDLANAANQSSIEQRELDRYIQAGVAADTEKWEKSPPFTPDSAPAGSGAAGFGDWPAAWQEVRLDALSHDVDALGEDASAQPLQTDLSGLLMTSLPVSADGTAVSGFVDTRFSTHRISTSGGGTRQPGASLDLPALPERPWTAQGLADPSALDTRVTDATDDASGGDGGLGLETMARERFTGTDTSATADGVAPSEMQLDSTVSPAAELPRSTAAALAADPPPEEGEEVQGEEARSLSQPAVDEPSRRSATAVSAVDAEQETPLPLLQSGGSTPTVVQAQARSPRQQAAASGQETAIGDGQAERKPEQDEGQTVLPPASVDASDTTAVSTAVSTDSIGVIDRGLDLEIVAREEASGLSQPAADDSSRRSSVSTADREKDTAAHLERELENTLSNLSAQWQDAPSPHGSFRAGSVRGGSFRAASFK